MSLVLVSGMTLVSSQTSGQPWDRTRGHSKGCCGGGGGQGGKLSDDNSQGYLEDGFPGLGSVIFISMMIVGSLFGSGCGPPSKINAGGSLSTY